MPSQWMYPSWGPGNTPGPLRPLRVEDVLLETEKPTTTDWRDWVVFADQAYLTARVLLQAGPAFFFPAHYLVGQTFEKYMKAILSKNGWSLQDLKKRNHHLTTLAQDVRGMEHEEFGDSEFLQLCSWIETFDATTRYPLADRLKFATNAKGLAKFLDEFVSRCRAILEPDGHPVDPYERLVSFATASDIIPGLLDDEGLANALLQAVRRNNQHIEERNIPVGD